MTDSLTPFIAALPKAELHLHLVGSASAETVLGLARRHPERGVPTEPDELDRFYEFAGFPHFINNYAKVDELVRTEADVHDLVIGAARDAGASTVRYAEITVTAAMHMRKGLSPEQLGATLSAARTSVWEQFGIEINYIYDIPAGFGGVEETVDFAVSTRPEGTVALGLAGLEADYPRADFAPAFTRARDAGLHVVAHAGETTGPEEVWAAVHALGAERIGHGIGSVSDPELLDHLARNDIPLELCPVSNLRTKAVDAAHNHPMPLLHAAGVPLTLSTDDPGMFHTDLNAEYRLAAELCGLGQAGLAELAHASVRYSYCSNETADRMHAEIDTIARTD